MSNLENVIFLFVEYAVGCFIFSQSLVRLLNGF